LDEDCDGEIDDSDEGWENTPCIAEAEGKCAEGHFECINSVQTCVPSEGIPEICNGIDDDCNGLIDDIDRVECRTEQCFGFQQCINAELLCINPNPNQMLETCNQIDDDCDGLIDESLIFDQEPISFITELDEVREDSRCDIDSFQADPLIVSVFMEASDEDPVIKLGLTRENVTTELQLSNRPKQRSPSVAVDENDIGILWTERSEVRFEGEMQSSRILRFNNIPVLSLVAEDMLLPTLNDLAIDRTILDSGDDFHGSFLFASRNGLEAVWIDGNDVKVAHSNLNWRARVMYTAGIGVSISNPRGLSAQYSSVFAWESENSDENRLVMIKLDRVGYSQRIHSVENAHSPELERVGDQVAILYINALGDLKLMFMESDGSLGPSFPIANNVQRADLLWDGSALLIAWFDRMEEQIKLRLYNAEGAGISSEEVLVSEATPDLALGLLNGRRLLLQRSENQEGIQNYTLHQGEFLCPSP